MVPRTTGVENASNADIIEDTHLTLAVILFKVRVNNSSKYSAITNIQEKFAEFPLLYRLIMPCSDQGIIDLNKNGNSATFFSYVCNAKNLLMSCFILLKIE